MQQVIAFLLVLAVSGLGIATATTSTTTMDINLVPSTRPVLRRSEHIDREGLNLPGHR